MTLVARTNYPRLKERFSPLELERFYTPTHSELELAHQNALGQKPVVSFLLLLKTFQRLGYFPDLRKVPTPIKNHITRCLLAVRPAKLTRLETSPAQLHQPQERPNQTHRQKTQRVPISSDNNRVGEKGFTAPAVAPAHAETPPATATKVVDYRPSSKTLYRYHHVIRTFLGVKSYDEAAQELITELIEELAHSRNNPADLLNAAVEKLVEARYELPAFSTLDRLVDRLRHTVHQTLFEQTANAIWTPQRKKLDWLVTPRAKPVPHSQGSEWQKLKALPKTPSLTHLQQMQERYDWLLDFGDLPAALTSLSYSLRKEFAAQARSLNAAEIAEFTPAKRYTLLACLVCHERQTARDALVETFLKRMAFFHKKARETLQLLRDHKSGETSQLLELLGQLARHSLATSDPHSLGQAVSGLLDKHGGSLALVEKCEELAGYHQNNYLPFVWKFYRSHRAALFKLVGALEFVPTTQSEALLGAVSYLLTLQNQTALYLPLPPPTELNLASFASPQWQKLIVTTTAMPTPAAETGQTHEPAPGESNPSPSQPPVEVVLNRRHLEVCIFSGLATDLKTGDLAVSDSEQFADYRHQLVSWEECKAELADFCAKTGLPTSAQELSQRLKTRLSETARQVNSSLPTNTHLAIAPGTGEIVLKKGQGQGQAKPRSRTLAGLEAALHQEIAPRSLLDIMRNVEHYTNWTRHFGPLSGNEPRLENSTERYILTTFSYGTNLGPTQTARHLSSQHSLSPHQIAFVNQRHVDEERLEAARRDIVGSYAQFELPRYWGDGSRAGADGTQIDLRRENPVSEYHVRYGGYGGIAYHHISDTYIALFTRFISCSTWEGVHILDLFNRANNVTQADTNPPHNQAALASGIELTGNTVRDNQAANTNSFTSFKPLVNPSDDFDLFNPTKLHADTQGQSTPIFGLAYLLGIELMPRIRNYKDLLFYRVDGNEQQYEHLQTLFKNAEVINWDLIKSCYQELMRVAYSLYKGKLLPSTLLRKLSSYSRKNRLYHAMRELGRAVRTEYLLCYISDGQLRQIVTATTNKVESFNNFSAWLSFGGGGENLLVENDPVEQQKRMQYHDLVANAVIYHNVIDLSRALAKLGKRGVKIYKEDLAALSPYLTRHIRRFGEYSLNLSEIPEPFDGGLETEVLERVESGPAAAQEVSS